MSEIFDKECIEKYGKKSCILYEKNNVTYESRLLDNPMYNKQINKYEFAELIPNLLKEKYTIIIIQNQEIVAVHLPVQSQLFLPPIPLLQ
jgi:uncharacterized membrane protein YbaN (DUF454 family)